MAQIIDRAGDHRPGDLEKDETRARVYISPGRALKSEQKRRYLKHAEEEKTDSKKAGGANTAFSRNSSVRSATCYW